MHIQPFTVIAAEKSYDTQNVIDINSYQDFVDFASKCYIDSWSTGKVVNLCCDIAFAGREIPVIPVFNGTFNGNGHNISGFNYEGSGYVTALFRYVEKDGVIDGLNVHGNVTSSDEKECIGGIVGINYGTVKNCNFYGTVSGMRIVGGIAAVNKGTGTISKCTTDGKVRAYYFTGGIAGKNNGVITGCQNLAGVNDDSIWVEEDDEVGSSIIDTISGFSRPEIYSGVDTGGIAGFSDGIIAGCENAGQIGYAHTGYNIGGIAGRQSGIVSMCSNTGTICGRKDVGGIVGQMEPYIKVIEAQTIRTAVNELHDLLEKTLDDLTDGKNVLHGDLKNLNAYADKVIDTGNIMADQLTYFLDANIEQLNLIVERFEYVCDCMPPVLNDLIIAINYIGEIEKDIKKLNDDINVRGRLEANGADYERYKNAEAQVENAVRRYNDAVNGGASDRINAILKDEDGNYRKWKDLSQDEREQIFDEIINIMKESEEMAGAVGDISDGLLTMKDVLEPYVKSMGDNVRSDIDKAADDLNGCVEYTRSSVIGLKGIFDYINAQTDIRFSALGEDFETQRANLYQELKDISKCMDILGEDASEYSDIVNDDLKAVNDKLNEIFNLVLDKMEAYSEFNTDGVYDDISDEEIEATTTGRVDGCTNGGNVEGDINIGGVAGSMAIDDEDMESNAAGSIDITIGNRYLTKCVINNSRNDGTVIAKKDGAGGIAGYMKLGAIKACESYGSVESTDGSYVGGICGQSKTLIRASYSLCYISGGKYVGGIAGYGDAVTDCYSMVYLEVRIGRAGAVAGQVTSYESDKEENKGKVLHNYYVDNGVHGIDGISYVGVAEPIAYDKLLKIRDIPRDFGHLKAVYRIDNVVLGTQELEYGESLEKLIFPDIPKKDGYYGVWPDMTGRVMTGNIVVMGEYRDSVRVVEGEEKDNADGEGIIRPYALVSEQFTDSTVLHATVSDIAPPEAAAGRKYVIYDVRLDNSPLENETAVALRLLNPYKKSVVYALNDGVWTEIDSKARGSYLQVEMNGVQGIYCVAEVKADILIIIYIAAAAAAVVIVAAVVKLVGKARKKKKRA